LFFFFGASNSLNSKNATLVFNFVSLKLTWKLFELLV